MNGALFLLLGISSVSLPAEGRPEDHWQPCPFLQLEDEGLLGESRERDERTLLDPLPLPPDRRAEPYAWREATRYLPDPPEAAGADAAFRGSWDPVVKEAAVSTNLSRWTEALGTPLGRRLFLGVSVELLGSEEDGDRRTPVIDPRHGTPRVTYLSTGFGLTLGF